MTFKTPGQSALHIVFRRLACRCRDSQNTRRTPKETKFTFDFLKDTVSLKDPLLTMILCAAIEKQDKGDLGQKYPGYQSLEI